MFFKWFLIQTYFSELHSYLFSVISNMIFLSPPPSLSLSSPTDVSPQESFLIYRKFLSRLGLNFTTPGSLLLTLGNPWPEVSEHSLSRAPLCQGVLHGCPRPGQHQPAPGLGTRVTVQSLCPVIFLTTLSLH